MADENVIENVEIKDSAPGADVDAGDGDGLTFGDYLE